LIPADSGIKVRLHELDDQEVLLNYRFGRVDRGVEIDG